MAFLAFTADNHLGASLRRADPQFNPIGDDAFRATCQCIAQTFQASGQTRGAVIFAGDLAENPSVDGGSLAALHQGLEVLRDAGLQLFYIQGNHDRQRLQKAPLLQSFGGIHLTADPVQFDGLALCGFDSMPGEQLKERLPSLPPCDLLVLHQPFEHLLRFEGAHDICMADLPSHARLVVSGDVHITDITTRDDGGLLLSPGPTHPRNISETNHDRGYGFVWALSEQLRQPVLSADALQFVSVHTVCMRRYEAWLPGFTAQTVLDSMPPGKWRVAVLLCDMVTEKQVQAIAEQLRPQDMLVLVVDRSRVRLMDQQNALDESELPVQLAESEASTFSLLAKLPLVISPDKDPLCFEILSCILPDTADPATELPALLKAYTDGTRRLPLPRLLPAIAAMPPPEDGGSL